jgi:RNase P subunit RPR2
MFKFPALATLSVVKQWVEDLTVNGAHDGSGGRSPVCKFDKLNLSLSGFALLNSCTPLLREEIHRLIPNPYERTGPRVYFEIIQKMASLSIAYTRTLEDKLKKLKLSDFKGENVQLYAEHCLNLVDEIRMTSLLPDLIPNLPSLVLVGLTKATHSAVSHQAALDMAKANKLLDRNGERIQWEPADILEPYVDLYKSLDQMGLYGPSSTTKAVQAMQAQVKDIQRTLEQDKSKKGSGSGPGTQRTCFECGSPDHLRNKCPKLQKGDSKGKDESSKKSSDKSSERKPYQIPGLSEAENTEVDKLIKTKLASLKPLADVSADAKHEIKFKDKIVAKFCRKCKRFLKGDKAHYTSEHRSKGGDSKPDTKPPETPTASLAAAAPALMRCDVPDYDTPSLIRRVDSDSDDDSVFQAFMAVPTEAPPTDVLPSRPAPTKEGPWREFVCADGEVTLFYGPGPDATAVDPAWLRAHGRPSTAAELNAFEAEFQPTPRRSQRRVKVHPKVRGGQATN